MASKRDHISLNPILFPEMWAYRQIDPEGKTIPQVISLIRDYAKRIGIVDENGHDCIELLEYFEISPNVQYGYAGAITSSSPWPFDSDVICYAIRGTSEGWYIHVDALSSRGPAVTLMVGKSFSKTHAMQVVAFISGVLTL